MEVFIRPKVEIARLLFLLGYAEHGGAWQQDTVRVADAADLIPVVAQALWRQTERLPLEIRHDELAHLAEMAAQPYVTLQVVPYGPNAGLSGGFMIASADGASDVAVAESLGDVTSGARAFVRKAAVVFDIVRGEALTVARSHSLITEVAGQWKSQV